MISHVGPESFSLPCAFKMLSISSVKTGLDYLYLFLFQSRNARRQIHEHGLNIFCFDFPMTFPFFFQSRHFGTSTEGFKGSGIHSEQRNKIGLTQMYVYSTCIWFFYVRFPSGIISVLVLVSLHHQCEFVRSGVCSFVPLLWAKPMSSHTVRTVSLFLPHSQAFNNLVALLWAFAFPVTSKNICPWIQ